MPRQNHNQKPFHGSADYYEPLLRARFVRGMKAVQKAVLINTLAQAIAANPRTAHEVVNDMVVADALKPMAKVITDAYMRGGKLGADHVREVLE